MSAEIVVRLACGCSVALGSADEAPVCQSHNERRVQSTKAPPPQFIAVDCDVTGPLVQKG